MNALVPVAASAVVSAILVYKFCDPKSSFHWLDRPNARSLHERPTPRTGGVGMMTGVAAGWLLAGMPAGLTMVLALLLAAVSLSDDARGLPVWLRLIAHLAAASSAAVVMGYDGYLFALAVLAIVWMTNLFNFMDGSDGLAGGMAVIGFGWYAAAAGRADVQTIALPALLIAGAAAGFLLFNFSPARIFLGDAGSIPLGFLAAALGLQGWRLAVWPAWFPILVFSPFIADASITLLRRALKGERIWQAHRDHAYQKLIRAGWSHRRVALCAYGLMMAAGGAAWALCAEPAPRQWLGLGVWGIAYALLFLAIELRWRSDPRVTS